MTDEKSKPLYTSYTDSETGEQHTAEVIPEAEYEKRMADKDLGELPIDGDSLTLKRPSSN